MSTTDDNTAPESSGKIHFADEAAAALLAGHIDQCNHPDSAGWQLVKQNPSRSVYRGQIDGADVYLKHYHGRSLSHRLRRLLGRSDALREMQFAKYLTANGIETPCPLAGRFDSGIEWLLSHAVAPAEAADQWHERTLRQGSAGKRAIQTYIAAIGTLIGKMHSVGVAHWDLHCGNIMLKTSSAEPQLVLMDLHRMQRRRRLSRRAMAANLAQLFHDRYHFTTRTERLRFLKHYIPASGRGGSLRGWQMLVEDFASRHTKKQYAQRDRRIVGSNRYFTRLKFAAGWRGHVVLASKRQLGGSKAAGLTFTTDQWRKILADPDSLFQGPDVKVIKDSGSSMIVRRKLSIGPHEIDVYIKRPRTKRLAKRFLNIFRPSRPFRAFKLGHQLLARRIATALPLAAIERRTGPFLDDSILIAEAVDAPHLYDFMETWLGNSPKGDLPLTPPQQRQLAQEVLRQLGRMLQHLHDNNFAHRDLKATNIRVRWSPGESPEIVLVDLDGLSMVRFMTARRKFQGLMRLNVSLLQCPIVNHAGQLRMLLGYLRRPGSGRIHFKPYWRLLEEWSARKLNQQIRSRRRRQKAVRRPA
ncbi:MAG: hypothetical protein K8S55_09530 [Phycisphaerae bacterium]|nr:hypothetical protein [Phycisphaerae bacterium]